MKKYKLTINKEKKEVNVSSDKSLLWVLREDLNLTGSKFGCGFGICGVCTVHIDGKAVCLCVLPSSEAADKNIKIIEGLSERRKIPRQRMRKLMKQ